MYKSGCLEHGNLKSWTVNQKYYKEFVVATGKIELVVLSSTSRNLLCSSLIVSVYQYIVDHPNKYDTQERLDYYKRKIQQPIHTWSITYLDDDLDEPTLSPELLKVIVLNLGFVELYKFYKVSQQHRNVIDSSEVLNLLVGRWLPHLKVSLISTYTELFITYTLFAGPTLADMDICVGLIGKYESGKLALKNQDLSALGYF